MSLALVLGGHPNCLGKRAVKWLLLLLLLFCLH